jgi:hypothetical protein
VKAELPITKRGDTTIFKVAAFEKGMKIIWVICLKIYQVLV